MTNIQTETQPRIYVACLAAYNAGRLHGRWIDATQDLDGIWEEVRNMLAASPEPGAEEWAIHDYEGFGSVSLSEWEGFETVHELALFIEEHGELGAAVLENFQNDLDQARQTMEEDYAGCHKSVEHFAEELAEETGELAQVPERFRYYIDFEAMGRDMLLGGDIFTIKTGFEEVHIFWNR